MRVSDSTVKRQIKILIDIKALSKVARYDKETGEQTSNLYTVIQVPPFINDLPPSSSTTYKPKSINQSQDIAKQIYKELTKAIGRKPVTKNDRGGWNKVVKDLKEANVDPRDIEAVVEAYRVYFKGMFITPHAISKHWGLLKQLIDENKPAERYDCSKNGHRLRDLDVAVEDTSPTSDYFGVFDLEREIPQGRSTFQILGSDFMLHFLKECASVREARGVDRLSVGVFVGFWKTSLRASQKSRRNNVKGKSTS